jgi:tRNA(fMet)-specific endonuclease VapC
MSRICLDTSAYSHFKRGAPAAVESVTRARWVGVPTIVLGELRTGFLLGQECERNERELSLFLNHPAVEVLDVDAEAARQYAEIMASLCRAGTPLPTNDVWIAAISVREGATVLTYDAHFESIRRVGCRILT